MRPSTRSSPLASNTQRKPQDGLEPFSAEFRRGARQLGSGGRGRVFAKGWMDGKGEVVSSVVDGLGRKAEVSVSGCDVYAGICMRNANGKVAGVGEQRCGCGGLD
jgi:hypothetical protein